MGPAKQDQRATFTLTKQLLHRFTLLQLLYILHDDVIMSDMYSALTKKNVTRNMNAMLITLSEV